VSTVFWGDCLPQNRYINIMEASVMTKGTSKLWVILEDSNTK
jgi:hypothetical protein